MVAHGMGDQKPDFAADFIQRLRKRVAELRFDPDDIAFQPLYWADLTEGTQKKYMSAASAASKLENRGARAFVVSAFGDATAYQRVRGGGVYEEVRRRVRETVGLLYEQVQRDDVPLIVVAHSLGGHIASNYIWDIQNPEAVDEGLSPFERFKTHAGMVTFGCNIPLFTFAYKELIPIKFPGGELSEDVRVAARWLNFFDRHDVLGWPLKPLSEEYRKVVSEDIEIKAGSNLPVLSLKSHSEYWKSKNLVSPTAALLCSVLQAAGARPKPKTRRRVAAQKRVSPKQVTARASGTSAGPRGKTLKRSAR